ncbi:hypothetical protein SAMN02983003_0061 [Devosia enhydra]|uniref:VanZ like family protein n=1 Tax=Devosia enhydra TaxID=665118 RepID=A0A1K2HTN0_9HYPH|nr:hypothetical protein [Devosia enhydra]SFZ80674.1 hypothetical protein SAMN02983003_0061 [Devosia enhydra]
MWHELKEPIVRLLDQSRDALHIHFGLIIFIAILVALRRHPKAALIAWFGVLAAQVGNEALDLHDWFFWTRGWNWRDALRDSLLTLIWPTVLLVLITVEKRRRRGD